jgi:signal transduction histidine kinase
MGRERIKIDLLIHDLKVPLAVIEAGATALLTRQEKYGPLTEKQERVLLRALRNTKVTQRLVNDALELGRSREGIINLGNVQVSSLIEHSLVELFDLADHDTSERIKNCHSLQHLRETLDQQGMLLRVNDEFWCQEVCLDETKMRQILRNLLNNALKYRKSRVELEVVQQGGYFHLSVKDDGEGIPISFHKKIFECYFQMDSEDSCPVRGHGLGLAGVLVLVEDMGGSLFLDSGEGIGTKFSVKLPLGTTR